ncbi:hypothetical protein E6H17_06910 [Candidatus Bathyarchaeota archaeon]|nr:MAG: hypothetical protein E6H17_06910 [Candidatus Bathyarchaeota archaeon]
MIGFLPISIVSAGISVLRTGAGALSVFLGSSDKQFTSDSASTMSGRPLYRGRPLNSYLKPETPTQPDQATDALGSAKQNRHSLILNLAETTGMNPHKTSFDPRLQAIVR